MPFFAIPEEFGTEEEYRSRITREELFNEFTRDENGNVVLSEEEANKKIEKLGGYEKLYRIKFEADYLAKLAYEGARKRYGNPLTPELEERIKFELHIMKTMGFPGYFLIVQDFINVSRDKLGVSVGPGRGSAAGSCVAYCLGITQIDPIKYDLLFERFLNPDRISLPDIDVDFDDDGRARVLQYVTEKYGAENVAHIITYGTMATKMAIKDVARVEGLPIPESDRLVKLIPRHMPEVNGKEAKLNLTNCYKLVPEFKAELQSPNPLVQETLKYAEQLEGNVRRHGRSRLRSNHMPRQNQRLGAGEHRRRQTRRPRARHAIRRKSDRGDRTYQDGLPGAEDAHHNNERRPQHQAHPRKGRRHGHHPHRRPGDLQALLRGTHRRHIPV